MDDLCMCGHEEREHEYDGGIGSLACETDNECNPSGWSEVASDSGRGAT